MKTLTEQFEEILIELTQPDMGSNYEHFLNKLLQAVKEREAYIIGKDTKKTKKYVISAQLSHFLINELEDKLRSEQRKRAEETL